MTMSYDKTLLQASLFDHFIVTLIFIALSISPPYPLLPKRGVTSLMIASYYGQASVVQALLQGGATINTATRVRHNCFMDSSN